MGDPNQSSPPPGQWAEDLLAPEEDEARGRAPESSPEALGRSDPFEASLDAPAPGRAQARVEVALPAALLVVDEDSGRGARTAVRLMEHGYTCRVAAPPELAAAARAERFEAIFVELGRVGDPSAETLLVAARTPGVPVVASTPHPLPRRELADATLLKPWLTDQAVRAIEEVRQRSRGSRAAPTLDAPDASPSPGARSAAARAASPSPPVPSAKSISPPASPAGGTGGASEPGSPTELARSGEGARVGAAGAPQLRTNETVSPTGPARRRPRIEGLPPGPIARAPDIGARADPWVHLEAKVVRVRLADSAGDGFSPGRARRASYEGGLEIESRRTWPVDTRLEAELALLDGRRAAFPGRVTHASEGRSEIGLELDASGVPFIYAWIEESLDPRRGSADPVRLTATSTASWGGGGSAPEAGGTPDLQALWAHAAADLDDDARQQRFIQACLASQQLDLAVRSYRALKEARPDDPRPQRYLQQVGTILGFYALKQSPSEVEDGALSGRLKATLVLFVLGAASFLIFALIWS